MPNYPAWRSPSGHSESIRPINLLDLFLIRSGSAEGRSFAILLMTGTVTISRL